MSCSSSCSALSSFLFYNFSLEIIEDYIYLYYIYLHHVVVFLLFFVLLFSLVLTPPFFFFFFWFFFYSWRDVKGSLTVYTPLNPAAVSVFVVRSLFFTPQWHVQCSASLSLDLPHASFLFLNNIRHLFSKVCLQLPVSTETLQTLMFMRWWEKLEAPILLTVFQF